ncbi:MAG: V-type ATP synthase subunit F [Candidatus Nanohaloarchaea archaeon]
MDKESIAVIGDQEFTLGFELIGIQKSYNPENYEEKLQELLNKEEIAILVLNQKDLEKLPKKLQKTVTGSVDPVTVTLSQEAESEQLQEKIKKAIGADIT